MVFPVVMYGCETWTMKKAEHRRIDAFELWCWRRLLKVPWTARRANQSIMKEISPGISLEGMMLKLRLQYFGQLMRRVDHWKRLWFCEGLRAGGEGDDRGWDGWMASLTRWTWVWMNSGRWWWTGRPGVLQFMGWQRVRHDRVTDLIWSVVLVWLDWLVFCDYGFSVSALWCPLAAPTILLGFLLPWAWVSLHGCSSKAQPLLLTLDEGVSPHCCPSWPSTWDSFSRPSCAGAATAPWTWGWSSRCHPWPPAWGWSSWLLPLTSDAG